MNQLSMREPARERARELANSGHHPDGAHPRAARGDRGQSAVLVVVVIVVIGVVLLAALRDFGAGAQDRTRAQSVADAAALASLDGGRTVAEQLAVRHGAVLVSWSRGPGRGEVSVVVRVGTATASARASNQP